jgi:hypothetical protein
MESRKWVRYMKFRDNYRHRYRHDSHIPCPHIPRIDRYDVEEAFFFVGRARHNCEPHVHGRKDEEYFGVREVL